MLGLLGLEDHFSFGALIGPIRVEEAFRGLIDTFSGSSWFEKFWVLKSFHDVVEGHKLEEHHLDHFVVLISHDSILAIVKPCVLLHINEREENVLHLSMKFGKIFLVRVQNDARWINQWISFPISHLFPEVFPIKNLTLELNSLLEIVVVELEAILVHIV